MTGKRTGLALAAALLAAGPLVAADKTKIPYFENETFESNFQKGVEASVTLQDGRVADLHDDFTWDWAPRSGADSPAPDQDAPASLPTSAAKAVDVWDSRLDQAVVQGSDAVRLFLDYRNHTDKRVVGVSITVKIADAFGKTLYQFSKDDDVVVEPMEQMKNDSFFVWKDDPNAPGGPYDRMWETAKNGTAKISVTVRKVVFEDGSVLTDKSK